MAIKLNDNIKILSPKPSDSRYLKPDNTSWTSVNEVNSTIPIAERHIYLIVNIQGALYWYQGGVENSDLKPYNSDTDLSTLEEKLNKKQDLGSDSPIYYASVLAINRALSILESNLNDYTDNELNKLPNYIEVSEKGVSIPDLIDGIVPTGQLPAYVDEVVDGQYIDPTHFEDLNSIEFDPNLKTRIYNDKGGGTGFYRWSGSEYVHVGSGTLVIGITASTAGRGDHTKTAYEHSQISHAPANAEKNVQSDMDQIDPNKDDYVKNRKTIPTSNSQIANDEGYIKTFTDTNTQLTDNEVKIIIASEGYKKTDNDTIYTEGEGIAISSENVISLRNEGGGESGLELGITHDKAYYGDKGESAYLHSQRKSGNPHEITQNDVGLDKVDNLSLQDYKNESTGTITIPDWSGDLETQVNF